MLLPLARWEASVRSSIAPLFEMLELFAVKECSQLLILTLELKSVAGEERVFARDGTLYLKYNCSNLPYKHAYN